ncbi:hypothetical protein DRE_06809 [Drechslerella stenobrocha 248]|uniref:PH domain-containing protein n=1 Tax=Drechslerella stenobrocha 248 TaxID=1043628 RepID=W7HK92_9PEZI|nr:hypothetical protein DRE_06809 [Drechslerella stenobrocha 248]
MASTAPKRKLRDPNEIFASLDRPLTSPISDHDATIPAGLTSSASSPIKPTPFSSPSAASASPSPRPIGKPQIVTSRRVLSISKRFMGTTGSLLRRTGSPPNGRRSSPPRRASTRKASGTRGGGIKPPLDLGPQHSPHDTVNVRERHNNASTSATHARSSSRGPERRRTMLANYTINSNFDELETSSARWGREPLALPAPPALGGYGSNAGSWKGSRAGSVVSNRDFGDWEDANSVAEASGKEDKAAWNSAPEDRSGTGGGTKKKKKRVPRDGVDVEEIRARKERRKKKLLSISGAHSVKGIDTDRKEEDTEAGDAHEGGVPLAFYIPPGAELEGAEDVAVIPTAVLDAIPPPLPPHAGPAIPSAITSKRSIKNLEDAPPSGLNSRRSARSLNDTAPSLTSKKSVKSLEGTTPGLASKKSIKSLESADLSREGTPVNSILDDDGIRVTPLRRKFTKAEKHERHKQRQAEREEIIEREKNRVREEERLRYQAIDRIREEERQKELERIREEEQQRELNRIKEEERERVLAEERVREEERRKTRELDLRLHREREEQKKREREKEEASRSGSARSNQERERLERERLEIERERNELEEQRRLVREGERREEERREEIMTEIERATQRSTTRARKKRKDKEGALAEEVQRRVGTDALRSKEDTASAIKAAVREVMSEMFGEIIFEDDTRQKERDGGAGAGADISNISSTVPTDATTSGGTEDNDHITRETTPDAERRIPLQEKRSLTLQQAEESSQRVPPGHNDISFRVVEFKKVEVVKPELKRPEVKKPGVRKLVVDIEAKKPAVDPGTKKPAAQPETKRTIAQPVLRSPVVTPEAKKPMVYPEVKAPAVQLNIVEPEPEPEPEPELEPVAPQSPLPDAAHEDTPTSPSSPETTPTKSSPSSIPKRRINLFGGLQAAKRRRKPFQSTIPEESASQLSTGESEPTSPPYGTRIFSFAPRTAAEPLSPPTTRQASSASSLPADAVSPPVRQISLASSSNHTDNSAATTSQIHRNLPNDENLNLPGQSMSSGLTRSLTSPAAQTNLAIKDQDPGDEYFVSVHEPLYRGSGIKRYKSTADLISILSERRPSSSTPELAGDELSYTEDLQLLEQRIVPVLLDAKLAKTEQEAAAGKRLNPEKLAENNPLKSIVDVSIALKRLNGIHERLADALKAATTSTRQGTTVAAGTSTDSTNSSGDRVARAVASAAPNPEEILKWAQTAKYVYEDYITYWKMDWDEVVISSEVLEAIERKKEGVVGPTGGGGSSGAGSATGAARINYLSPSPLAEEAFISFQTLVGAARHKVAEERARLEDEAAACIDASRVRDLQTFEICYGVVIEPHRRVRARDIFGLTMQHSLGKKLSKTVELYLRDDSKGGKSKTKSDNNAELMICEIAKEDEGRKWLAFQPLPVKWITAKQGPTEGDMVLDVNARLSDGTQWRESMVLSADPMIKMEWLHLLGAAADEVSKASRMQLDATLVPPMLPPVIDEAERRMPILTEIETQLKSLGIDDAYSEPPTPGMSVISEIDRIPESDTALMNEGAKPGKPNVAVVVIPGLSDLYDGGALAVPVYGELPHIVQMMPHYVGKKRISSPPPSTISPMSSASYGPARLQRRRTRHEQRRAEEDRRKEELARTTREIQQKAAAAEKAAPTSPKQGRKSRSQSPSKPASLSFKIATSPPTSAHGKKGKVEDDEDALSVDEASLLSWYDDDLRFGRQKGGYELADGGIIQRARSESGSSGDGSSILSESTLPSAMRAGNSARSSASSARSKVTGSAHEEDDSPPPVPLHTSPSQEDLRSVSSGSSGGTVRNASRTSQPYLAPPSSARGNLRRRMSSPLKHEYAPSSATESDGGSRSPSNLSRSDSDTDSSTSSEAEDDIEDERSDDELSEAPPQRLEDEDGDLPGPMFEDMIAGRNLHSSGRKDVVQQQYEDISRSRSDRTPPSRHSTKNSVSGYTTGAFVFTWSSKGAWEKISEEENRVALLENFIEVYAAAPDGQQGKTLLSFEVTPVTPIRRGTAVDLSIRAGSLSTEKRANQQGGTVMFRSRSPQDCEALYNAINTARINACTNGFGGSGGKPGRKGSIGRSGSVRGYRAANVDAPGGAVNGVGNPAFPGETASIIMSESSSLGSLGSAFSAFKGSLRSSIFGGTKSSSGGSWMSSSSTSSGLAGPRGIINPLGGIPITGIGGEAPYQGTGYVSNLKVKLWKRESSGTKWADLGPGRLNVITPPPGHAARGGGGLSSNEKRVVVRDRKGQNTLLDVVLGESCFERVARTGIAVHVPVEDDGFVPTLVNAGMAGRNCVFMLQFKGENETRETFRIVGKKYSV